MKKKNLTSNNRKFKTKKVANIYDGWEDMSVGEKAGGIASAAAGALQLVGDAMNSANQIDTSKADNAIEAVESLQPSTSSLDSLADQLNSFNAAKTDWEGSDFGMSTAEGLTSLGTSMASGASAGAALGPWGAVAGAAAGLITSGASWIANAVKSKSKADELNRLAENANYLANQRFTAARDTIKENETNNFMSNIKSNGGNIYIKPSKKGTFTSAARQRGLGVQEFASKVLTNKDEYSTAMVRKTNFAKNASKWHAYGGPLYNHSGDWSNGLTFVNEGGTHEENPFDGVLMGFDQNNIPNLVEEGEIIYNDYVFSNRLKPSSKQLESSGLNKKYNDWTFAKIVEDLQKTSAETPLDKISKESLDDMMATMINMQEEVRMKKGLKGQNKLMTNGGNLFAGGGPAGIDPYLTGVDISDIINTTSEKLNFYNEPFVPDTFDDLPDVTPSSRLGTMSTIPYMTSIESAIQKKAIPDASIKDFNDYVNTEMQNRVNTKNKNSSFNWNNAGQALPIISNAAKAIYNAATPIDYSNVISEQAYRETPVMSLPRLGGKQVYRGIDRNRLINPIINTGRATALDIQNNALTAGQALANLANANYNTQRAIGEAYANAEQQDLANRLQVAQFNLGIDQANANLSQAEQVANIQRANRIAAARIQDAAMREQLQQMKGQAFDITSNAAVQGAADLARQNMQWDWIKKTHPEGAKVVSKNGGLLTRKKRRK